ncbi:uncharacterized protein LOC124261878 [Haliotis rubra]|uniref:uncharacterized protein LOC124261878 n=1 Tax=Haliotis rubra TaxID=36100 RepID=UPI001EE5F470|nr:uncharacterized protein LOC124261878 [Haliotis rubra]
MRMVVWGFVQLFLTITMTYSSASQCGILTCRHHGSLDGQMFNDTFITEQSFSDKAACFWRCFRNLQCNMVLHNPASQRCRLYYSSVITGGEQEAGWQYYTVACSDFRILNALSVMRNQTHEDVTCSNGFSYLPTTSGKCFHDNVPLDIGRCMQTLWIDPVRVFRTSLPAPLSSGTEIIVEAAADGVNNRNWVRLHVNGDSTLALSLVVRWDTMDIGFNTRSSGVWSTALSHPDVVFTPNVISNLSIKITDTQFLISVDDNNLFTGPIRVPVQQADAIDVDFTLIKRLQLKYP